MNMKTIAFFFALVTVFGLLVFGGLYISYNRQELHARTACEAQRGNAENVLDNMWKNFQEIGGIPDRERKMATALFREYAEARTAESQGAMMAWITEQVPAASPQLYADLQARLTAGRQEYRQSQTYMLELLRTHGNIIADPFRSLFLKNTEPVHYVVVSSADTKKAMQSGNDERVFKMSETQ